MKPEDSEREVYLLLDALCLLAAERGEQSEYLARRGFFPLVDELALQLDAHYAPGERWEFHRLLTEVQLQHIAAVDEQLRLMSKPELSHLWNARELDNAVWNKVRELAR